MGKMIDSYLQYKVIFNIARRTAVMMRLPVNINLLEAARPGCPQALSHLITGEQDKLPKGWSRVFQHSLVVNVSLILCHFGPNVSLVIISLNFVSVCRYEPVRR